MIIIMGNLWRPISGEPRALTKADKNIHFKTHTRHTHTYTHRKNTSIVVMGLMETEERK